MHPIDRIATLKPLVDLTKDSMASVLPSLAEIGVIDAIRAQLALVERLESVYTAATASELPRRLIPTKKSPHHVVLTMQRFAPKTETSFPLTLLARMGETLVVLSLLAPMDASKAVLMLLLASRLAARGDRTRVDVAFATALPDRGGLGITAFAGRGDSNGSFLLEESSVLSQTLSR
jgi:hypothetical protein